MKYCLLLDFVVPHTNVGNHNAKLSPRRLRKKEFSPKAAKHKWDSLENSVCRIIDLTITFFNINTGIRLYNGATLQFVDFCFYCEEADFESHGK